MIAKLVGKKSKAQAGVMDTMIFLLVASGAATLLIYIAGAYGTSANQQIAAIYNYEFAGNALVALHYAQDAEGNWFFDKVKETLALNTPESLALGTPEKAITAYLNGDAAAIWEKLVASSPTKCVALRFTPPASIDEFEYPDPATRGDGCITTNRPVYASSLNIHDDDGVKWTVSIRLYY